MNSFDVGIVGASISGSTLALQLAQSGLSVVLFDAVDFPRGKPCGEGLSSIGYTALQRALPALAHRVHSHLLPYFGFEVREKSFAKLAELTGSEPHGYGISRETLDGAIVEACRNDCRISLHLGESVTAIDSERGDITSGKRTVMCRYIVLADGGASKGAALLDIKNRRAGRGRCGLTFHFRGKHRVGRPVVQILVEDDCEYFCTPLVDGGLNVSVLGRVHSPALRSHAERTFPRLFEQIGYSGVSDGRALGVSRVGDTLRPAVVGRVLLVGDACEQLDPIGGMGMTHAVVSSSCAASALRAILAEGENEVTALRGYAVERERRASLLRGFTEVIFSLLVRHRHSMFSRMALKSRTASRVISSAISNSGDGSLGRVVLSLVGGVV